MKRKSKVYKGTYQIKIDNKSEARELAVILHNIGVYLIQQTKPLLEERKWEWKYKPKVPRERKR